MPLKLFPIKYLVPGLAATLLPVGVAQAVTLTFTDSVDSARTNFTSDVSIPQFDSSLGELTNIFIELAGSVSGSIQLESTDADSSNVTANLVSEIKLQRPDMSDLVVVLPTASEDANFTAFDGTVDFGGTSGLTRNNLSETATESILLTDPSDFGIFLGTGNLVLPVAALGRSNASGSGNLATVFQTFAGADITVSYEYTERPTAVPEPNAPMGALALVGLGMMAKRKLAKKA
ncbi:MAG: choice-of-anchor E domain-containing protein [Geitlerinemataceae cyanobacterium]